LSTSDSLKATVIVIVPVLTISVNGELVLPDDEEDEVEVPEPPRLPVVVPEELPVEDPDEDEVPLDPLDVADVEALPVEPADTASPGERAASDTIVPLIGAYSLVSLSAVCALSTLACALSTAACAEAMLPAEDGVLVEPLVPELPPDPPAVELLLVDEPDSALLS
jgi:hypothetical protein